MEDERVKWQRKGENEHRNSTICGTISNGLMA